MVTRLVIAGRRARLPQRVSIMKTFILALAAIGGLSAAPALGQANSGGMLVMASVAKSCTVSSTQAVVFPTVQQNFTDIGQGQVGQVNFICTKGTAWFVTADDGENPAGHQRQLVGPESTDLLKYNLFVDDARTIAFPTAPGTPGSGLTGGTGDGNQKTVSVYGSIPSGQPLPTPGDYTDSVQMTVNY